MKNLIKSYKFWTALAGSIGLLAVNVAKLFGYEITATGVEETIMAICGVLVVFGIVKKPAQQTSNSQDNQVSENKDGELIENTSNDNEITQNANNQKQ